MSRRTYTFSINSFSARTSRADEHQLQDEFLDRLKEGSRDRSRFG